MPSPKTTIGVVDRGVSALRCAFGAREKSARRFALRARVVAARRLLRDPEPAAAERIVLLLLLMLLALRLRCWRLSHWPQNCACAGTSSARLTTTAAPACASIEPCGMPQCRRELPCARMCNRRSHRAQGRCRSAERPTPNAIGQYYDKNVNLKMARWLPPSRLPASQIPL